MDENLKLFILAHDGAGGHLPAGKKSHPALLNAVLGRDADAGHPDELPLVKEARPDLALGDGEIALLEHVLERAARSVGREADSFAAAARSKVPAAFSGPRRFDSGPGPLL